MVAYTFSIWSMYERSEGAELGRMFFVAFKSRSETRIEKSGVDQLIRYCRIVKSAGCSFFLTFCFILNFPKIKAPPNRSLLECH